MTCSASFHPERSESSGRAWSGIWARPGSSGPGCSSPGKRKGMSGDRLSGLQWCILGILSGMEPPWTLTGGAALVGIHLKHRTTKDLDLFFRKVGQLGALPDEVRSRLTEEGLEVSVLRSGLTFAQLRVNDGTTVCIVDLVAEPVPSLEPPLQVSIGEAVIAVDTPHEILVN